MQRIGRLLGIGILAVFVQATLVTLSPIRDVLPDVVLPAVLFVATQEVEVVAGVAIAFVVGYVFDLLSGAPPGCHCAAFQFIYLLGRWARRRLYLAGVLFEIGLAFGAVLVAAAIVLTIRVAFQDVVFADYGGIVTAALVRAALTAVLAPAVFWSARAILTGRRSTLLQR